MCGWLHCSAKLIAICSIIVASFMPKFMLHNNTSNFSRSKYSNSFPDLLLRALGVQILWYSFEVFGPGVQILRSSWIPWGSSYFRGGPNTSALLWSNWPGGSKYFVVGPGGTILGGSIFTFRRSVICWARCLQIQTSCYPSTIYGVIRKITAHQFCSRASSRS